MKATPINSSVLAGPGGIGSNLIPGVPNPAPAQGPTSGVDADLSTQTTVGPVPANGGGLAN